MRRWISGINDPAEANVLLVPATEVRPAEERRLLSGISDPAEANALLVPATEETMLPEHYVEKKLEYVAPELRDIVLEIRNIVARVTPGATESQHSRGFSYYFKERGGPVSAGICQIGIFRDHVRLGFIHGAFLPDPQGLMVGEPKYKKHIRLYHYEDAPWEYLRELIAASARFDPYTLKERPE